MTSTTTVSRVVLQLDRSDLVRSKSRGGWRWRHTGSADDEGETDPHAGSDHFIGVGESGKGEDRGECDGGREVGDVVPYVHLAQIFLEGRHDDGKLVRRM
jgi:hypothetical protein